MGLVHFGPAEHINLSQALFVLLAPEFFMPLRQLAIHYHDRAAALGATDAILNILEQEAEVLSDLDNDIDYIDEVRLPILVPTRRVGIHAARAAGCFSTQRVDAAFPRGAWERGEY